MSDEFRYYIEANYEKDDHIAIARLQRGEDGRGVMRQQIKPREEVLSEEYRRFLRAQNVHGADIYAGVNAYKPGATGRLKTDVAAVRHVFLDIDEDGKSVVDKLLAGKEVLPHHILESSPGRYQALWSVEGMSADQGEAATRGLIKEFGGDPAVWDSARILRVPGFRNWKPEYAEQKPWVKDLDIPKAAVNTYTLEHMQRFVELGREQGLGLSLDAGNGREPGRLRERGGPDRSQSSSDFAFAMRHLEKGDMSAQEIAESIRRWRESHPDIGRPRSEHDLIKYSYTTVESAMRKHERQHGMTR